jgi:hypothetical protein
MMAMNRTTQALAFAMMLGAAAFAAPSFADDQTARWWEPMIKKMANKDGMVTKRDFMTMMEKKFDEMDRGKRGMLSTADVMRIFSDKTGN